MSKPATAVECLDELIAHVNEEVVDLQKKIDWQKSIGQSGGVAKMRHTRDAYQVVLEWLAVLREKIVECAVSQPTNADRGDLVLLQNVGAGYIGNSPVFYHRDGGGYTQWIDDAKAWTNDQADRFIRSTQGTHTWRKWPVNYALSIAKATIDIQDDQRRVAAEVAARDTRTESEAPK